MKVICNKAKECNENCIHKIEHLSIKEYNVELAACVGFENVKCIPVSEPKREVIEVTKCVECYYANYDSVCCYKHKKELTYENIYKHKPDYCKVKRIVVEMEEK